MNRTRVISYAVLAAASAAALSACGPLDVQNQAAKPAAAPASASAAPGAAQGSADGSGIQIVDGAPTGAGNGDQVEVKAGRAGKLNPVLVDQNGMTLYRFDKDVPKPPATHCVDACATSWPPLIVAPGGTVYADGVDPSVVGTVQRPDGSWQVTVGGWPAYDFAKDTKPGDTRGQGVSGTWFGLLPTGGKAGVAGKPSGRPAPAPQTSSAGSGY
jgi:predicted lipoprotein with Yx(FWY)xxD motif